MGRKSGQSNERSTPAMKHIIFMDMRKQAEPIVAERDAMWTQAFDNC